MTFSFKKLKHVRLRQEGHLFGFGTGPDADWKIIFSWLSVSVIIVLLIGLYMFVKVYNGELFVAPKPDQKQDPTLNTTLLNKTISYYAEKANTLEKIKTSKEVVVDPSR